MRITKLVHSCLLVEMPDPVNRTVLFDPGAYSEAAVEAHDLRHLDDIVITHTHFDHFHLPLIKKLVAKFPDVKITAPPEIVDTLAAEGIKAGSDPAEGMTFFDSPHEVIKPFYPVDPPQEIGVHYLDKLSHPGDSHSFKETKAILALPVQAPWGSSNAAVKLALQLKPKHVLPIHDWHWSDEARASMYGNLEAALGAQGITFHKLETGVPVVINLD